MKSIEPKNKVGTFTQILKFNKKSRNIKPKVVAKKIEEFTPKIVSTYR